MNGPEDNAKHFALSSGPFIKGLMLFYLRGGEFPDHQAREFTPDECFNPPLELFGPGWSISTLRTDFVRFASKIVLISPNLRPKEPKSGALLP